jgi:hypothetical protein
MSDSLEAAAAQGSHQAREVDVTSRGYRVFPAESLSLFSCDGRVIDVWLSSFQIRRQGSLSMSSMGKCHVVQFHNLQGSRDGELSFRQLGSSRIVC